MKPCATIVPLLEEYAEGSLDADGTRAVEAHLRACARCQEGASALVELRGRPAVAARNAPDHYWATVLPRVRERLDHRSAFELPAFILRGALPAIAGLFLLVVAVQLIPIGGGNEPGDAALILRSLAEADLASVAEHHDSEAIITLPADAPEAEGPDLDEAAVLEVILEGEAGVNLYAFLDTEIALSDLPEEDQSELISMLEHE